MHAQDTHWSSAATLAPGGAAVSAAAGSGRADLVRTDAKHTDAGRTTPLRVDAQRNLEHVLRAAREVFGELGYGAPMEDVARRARVGVGTVYRRFPSKDVLVRRIAEEETARLTEQARAALGQEEEPWSALSRFLRTSVASGAGRLLPPQVLRVRGGSAGSGDAGASGGFAAPGGFGGSGGPGASAAGVRVPQQRYPVGPGELRLLPEERSPAACAAEEPGVAALLEVVGQLVERARAAGELRADVSVSDVLLVIATAAPSLPDAEQRAAASARLLEILLEGLRSRPA
ncbi:helix-turn-helix domain-containing protein [Streptomyces sp. TG1A-8]|uniref:TetR/AcrR family transcriptional regulator n=1 Tax=Streptomyces sp. TG1A-8 TaxID=3051385 RepID=UPI00265BE023|nr:helix-turn-helix domain-containing protein [Streptomyces sp. TG1A-8]MDO0927036.1 helix-turn-helix domain-containing protein [Streptomyces sp. TG1A-8]